MLRDPRKRWVAFLLLPWAAVASPQDLDQTLRDGAQMGQVEVVRSLLAEGVADVDSADGTGWTPLMYAARGGHDEIVDLLLGAGARVDQKNESRQTALHLAASHGRAASAHLLLRAGADLELKDAEGRTPLYRAIENRHADVIEMLQAAALAKAGGLSLATTESPGPTLPPRIVESTLAPYPESVPATGIEGSVVLMVLVRRDGSVGAAHVSEGLEPSLDQSALRTVKEWKFAPAMRNGRTVEVVLEVEVRFRPPATP